jgi:hypothetical protein
LNVEWANRSLVVALTCVFLAVLRPGSAAGHPCLCSADVDRDGEVDQWDVDLVLGCLGEIPVGDCLGADVNCDGVIDILDIDPDDPFGGESAFVCLTSGAPVSECCPGHTPCGDPTAGSCYEANGTRSCDDLECCLAVCGEDAFCCDAVWDDACAIVAIALCPKTRTLTVDANTFLVPVAFSVACGDEAVEVVAPFGEDVASGAEVVLVAPAEHNGACFERWTLDGVGMADGVATLSVTMDDDRIARAEFGCLPGDCNLDGQVTLDEFPLLGICATGSQGGETPPLCDCVDLNGDSVGDVLDYGLFQLAFSRSQP